jgi:hypothetical protein
VDLNMNDDEQMLKNATAGECHAMVDIETLGQSSGALVLQIAAVRFWPFGEPPAISTGEGALNMHLDISAQSYRSIDADTVLWWMRQGPEALRRITDTEIKRYDLHEAELAISAWAREPEITHWWAKPPGFDITILRSLFSGRGGLKEVIPFRQERDLRTLILLNKAIIKAEMPPEVGTTHDALDDAYNQAGVAITILRRLREMNK